jgi:hypothetical protein
LAEHTRDTGTIIYIAKQASMIPSNFFPPPPVFHYPEAKDGTRIHFDHILLKTSPTFVKMLLSSVVALIFSSAVTSGKRSNFLRVLSLSS